MEGQPVGCIHTFRPASKRIHFNGRWSRDCKTEEIDITDGDAPRIATEIEISLPQVNVDDTQTAGGLVDIFLMSC